MSKTIPQGKLLKTSYKGQYTGDGVCSRSCKCSGGFFEIICVVSKEVLQVRYATAAVTSPQNQRGAGVVVSLTGGTNKIGKVTHMLVESVQK